MAQANEKGLLEMCTHGRNKQAQRDNRALNPGGTMPGPQTKEARDLMLTQRNIHVRNLTLPHSPPPSFLFLMFLLLLLFLLFLLLLLLLPTFAASAPACH